MRIAQVAPLYESVPPRLYGGTERVVAYLTDELVRQGHEVTLYASADSRTLARLEPQSERGLRHDPTCSDPIPDHVTMLERVSRHADRYEIIHYHTAPLHYPLARRQATPCVTTLHGRLDLPELVPLHREYGDLPLVSISEAQRRPLAWCNWEATVYHGLPRDLLRCCDGSGGYVVMLGRISPEKRPDLAIEIARRAGMTLRIAAKVDKVDIDYFNQIIRPLLRTPGVEFVGEIDETQKQALLGDARAMLFPIDWPEPFGLVMIESFACGTPVIAFACGSVPEVMVDGVTGFVVSDTDAAVAAVERVVMLDRRACRAVFEARFSVERMALDYLHVYERILTRAAPAAVPPRRQAG